MASETTTTSANDVYLAAQLEANVLAELRPQNVSRPFFRTAMVTQSTAVDFPIQADPGVGAASTEGTGLSNTELTTDKATATMGTVGQMATVTDELKSAAYILDAYAHFGAVLARSTAEKWETDMTALLDDFSNTTSTTGIDLTLAKFYEAKGALIARDIPGNYVAVLHPVQVNDLGIDMSQNTAAVYANSESGSTSVLGNSNAGFQFNLFGVPVYQTSLIPTANSSADRAGAIFASNHAVGLGIQWDTRIELERDASLPGTEVVATARYGVIEIRDGAGQTVVSDA